MLFFHLEIAIETERLVLQTQDAERQITAEDKDIEILVDERKKVKEAHTR